MTFEITCLSALEIIDATGRPTLEVGVQLADGTRAMASAPSGRSTRWSRAVELRDKDMARFDGDGVVTACERVRDQISSALIERTWTDLAEVDEVLAQLDATQDDNPLGSNTTIGVSMALARALSRSAGKPLYSWLPRTDRPIRLPVPLISALAGGADLPNRPAFAEFLICPVGAPSLPEAMRAGVEVYHAVGRRLKHDGLALGVSDDGAYWCALTKPEAALRLLVNSIYDAGYPATRNGIAIGIDVDAPALHRGDGTYQVGAQTLSAAEMIAWYTELVDAYPIRSIEDGLGADDTVGWQSLTSALGDRVQLIGDEIIGSQPARIRRARDSGMGNAAVVKLDQVSTVSQALDSLRQCHEVGFAQIVAQNPGETADTFIADLTVASGCGQIAAGAPVRGERVAKYNRLLQIASHVADLPYGIH